MKDVVIRFTGQSTKFLLAFSSTLKRLQPQSLKNLLWLFTEPGRRRQSDSSGITLGKLCISPNPSLRAQRSNPFLLANQSLMDRRVAALLAMTGLCRPSLGKLCISPNPSLRSNPYLLTNQTLMDRRVASLLEMTDLCRPSLANLIFQSNPSENRAKASLVPICHELHVCAH